MGTMTMAARPKPLVEQSHATKPSTGRPIDLVHLARMTLGERSLEREVLQLFERQAMLLLTRMEEADPESLRVLAHTLKGSARGIGAFRAGNAAEAVERAAASAAGPKSQLAELREAVTEAGIYIREILSSG